MQELGADKAGQGETVRSRNRLHLHEDGRAAEGEQERNEYEKRAFGEKYPESAARPLVSSSRPDSSRSAGAREKTGSMSVSTTEKVTRKAVTSSETAAA